MGDDSFSQDAQEAFVVLDAPTTEVWQRPAQHSTPCPVPPLSLPPDARLQVMPLVEAPEGEGVTLSVPRETAEYLRTLRGPFHVISIVGKLRYGKSYLLSLLVRYLFGEGAGSCDFGVSSQMESFTKGVLMCAVPLKGGGTVVFLDSEGSDSLERDTGYNKKVFSIVHALSGVMLFNMQRVPNDASQVENLACCVEIARSLRLSGTGGKTMHIVCRDSHDAPADGDGVFRSNLIRAVTSKGQESRTLQQIFTKIDISLLAPPLDNFFANKEGLLDRQFAELSPHFRAPFLRLAEQVAESIRSEQRVLSMKGSAVMGGGYLADTVINMVSHQEDSVFADFLGAGEMLQRAGMQRSADAVMASVWDRVSNDVDVALPLLPQVLHARCERMRDEEMRPFANREGFIVVNEALYEEARDDLTLRVGEAITPLLLANTSCSREAARDALVDWYARHVQPNYLYFAAWSGGNGYWEGVRDAVRGAREDVRHRVSEQHFASEEVAFLQQKSAQRDHFRRVSSAFPVTIAAAVGGGGFLSSLMPVHTLLLLAHRVPSAFGM